jgi:hypothetical protein
MRIPAIILSALLLSGLAATPAEAASKKEASYPYERVWPAAVRFLRIDAGVELLEKDADAGYVLFELEDDGKTFKGALEVIRIKDSDGRDAVRLMLRLEDRPSYMEIGMLKRLVRKLYVELGPPAPAPPKRKPKPPADDGGDDADTTARD